MEKTDSPRESSCPTNTEMKWLPAPSMAQRRDKNCAANSCSCVRPPSVFVTVRCPSEIPLSSRATTVWLPGCGSKPRVIMWNGLLYKACTGNACLNILREAPWYPATAREHLIVVKRAIHVVASHGRQCQSNTSPPQRYTDNAFLLLR